MVGAGEAAATEAEEAAMAVVATEVRPTTYKRVSLMVEDLLDRRYVWLHF